MTHAGGRPTKYREKFCQTVIEVGEQGGWVSEMAEACDVHRSSIEEWAKEHPEFSTALMRAKQKARVWFEKAGRVGLTAERFNSALWAKQMSARHPDDYTDRLRAEHDHSGKVSFVVDASESDLKQG